MAATALTVAENDIFNLRSQGSDPHHVDADANSTSQLALLGGGYASTVSGSVASVVTFGADGFGRFAFAADAAAAMTGLGLTSKGGQVTFVIEPLTGALVGYVDGTIFGSPTPGFQPLIDRPVMSVELDSNGHFVVRLYDQLDHVKAEGGNGANTELATKSGGVLSGLDLGRIVDAFDGDGDKVRLDGKLVITVKDDVPSVSINTTGKVVLHDETAGAQTGETSNSGVKNLFNVLGAGNALGYGRADLVDTFVKGGADDSDPTVNDLRNAIALLDSEGLAEVARLLEYMRAENRTINLSRWTRAMGRTGDRVGLVLCGDLPAAVRFSRETAEAESLMDLLDFAISPSFGKLRQQMGLSIDV